jgi:hypothetical protein
MTWWKAPEQVRSPEARFFGHAKQGWSMLRARGWVSARDHNSGAGYLHRLARVFYVEGTVPPCA